MPETESRWAPFALEAAFLSAARSSFDTIADVIGLDRILFSRSLTCASVRLALLSVGTKALSRVTSAEMAR
jgi:hypothetical protein